MLMKCAEWRTLEKIDQIPLFGENDSTPFLCAIRGYKCQPDVNIDPLAKTVPSFSKFYPYLGGIAYHKFDKSGSPVLVSN